MYFKGGQGVESILEHSVFNNSSYILRSCTIGNWNLEYDRALCTKHCCELANPQVFHKGITSKVTVTTSLRALHINSPWTWQIIMIILHNCHINSKKSTNPNYYVIPLTEAILLISTYRYVTGERNNITISDSVI